jgi:hypothetical protein
MRCNELTDIRLTSQKVLANISPSPEACFVLILNGKHFPVWEGSEISHYVIVEMRDRRYWEVHRMSLRRSLFALVLLFGLMAGTVATTIAGSAPAQPSVSSAQQDDDATPEADDGSTSGRTGDDDAGTTGSGSTVEDVAVEVVDESGAPSLSITLSNFTDSWKDYEDYSAPDRGFHYAYFELTVENIGDRDADVSSYDVFVRDEEGFLYGSAFVTVLEDSPTAELDEFNPDGPIAAGDTYTGYIIVAVPNESELVDVFYAPSGRLITIATLGGDAISED